MLKLYYTGPRSYLAVQQKPSYSLGGYPSSSIVPNGQNGSLFSEVSSYTKQNEITEVIGLILKNEDEDIEDLQFYFDLPDNCIGQYQIAVVALSKDSKDQYIMEEIGNSESLPYYAKFHDALKDSPVGLGPLAQNGMLGVWIKRSITFSIKDDEQVWNDYLNLVVDVNKESIGLKFTYDQSIIESSSSGIIDVTLKLIERLNKNSNFSLVVPANVRLQYIDLNGTSNLKIGTTPNGNEIFDTKDISGQTSFEIGQTYESSITLYFTINLGSVDIFVYYLEI
jgi:hypothetical protein